MASPPRSADQTWQIPVPPYPYDAESDPGTDGSDFTDPTGPFEMPPPPPPTPEEPSSLPSSHSNIGVRTQEQRVETEPMYTWQYTVSPFIPKHEAVDVPSASGDPELADRLQRLEEKIDRMEKKIDLIEVYVKYILQIPHDLE